MAQAARRRWRWYGWSMERNVPLISGGRIVRVDRDVWAAGQAEEEWLWRAFEEALGGRLPGGLVIFKRAAGPTGGYGVEVYAHGARLGLLAFEGRRWAFYPSGAAASILATLGAEAAEARGARGRLKGKRVTLERCPASAYAIVAAGGYVGPARVVSRDPCTVKVKDMAPQGFRPLPPSTLADAADENRASIEALAREAVGFIRREASRRGASTVYVAVSGGADSTATLSLAVEALGSRRVVAVYADTGMEFPESRETAELAARKLGVTLEVVESGVDPVEEIARRGLMTRDNRWCTRILKLRPLAEYYRRAGARLVADGARALESDARATTPRVGVNPLIPFVTRILPIHHWTRLEVQLYLALRRLPLNPLYDQGLARIGCKICPAMHDHELLVASKLHKEFYERLADKLGATVDELVKGGWRLAPRKQPKPEARGNKKGNY